jgi:predicted Zn-dependent peptidase
MISNGVKLVLFARQGAPFNLQAIFAGGSSLDPLGKEGTAHFLEHMLVAGTQQFPTKDKLAAFIEQYGGGFSAFTGVDTITVNVGIGDPDDIERAILILNEILYHPLFNEKTIETERGSIFNELDASVANPGRRIWDVWRTLFFQGTPAGRPILGTKESIGAISKEDLIEFYRQHILAGRSVIVAAGGVVLNALKRELDKVFSRAAVYTNGTFFAELPVIREKAIAIEPYEKNDQIHALFGFRTRPAGGMKRQYLISLPRF